MIDSSSGARAARTVTRQSQLGVVGERLFSEFGRSKDRVSVSRKWLAVFCFCRPNESKPQKKPKPSLSFDSFRRAKKEPLACTVRYSNRRLERKRHAKPLSQCEYFIRQLFTLRTETELACELHSFTTHGVDKKWRETQQHLMPTSPPPNRNHKPQHNTQNAKHCGWKQNKKQLHTAER